MNYRPNLFFLLALMLMVAGCLKPRTVEPKGFFGPTLTLSEAVDRINQNNTKLATLWARHSFEADIVDDKGKSHFVNGDGLLLYRSGNDFRMTGEKVGQKLFDMGTNAESFWLIVRPEMQTMWHGRFDELSLDDLKKIPVRPDLVMEVLGIGPIERDFNQLPAPVMRFNNDRGAYMFVWHVKFPDRWVAQREIWYDHQTMLPQLVLLFDENGRVVLRAYLSKHVEVEVPDLPREQWPKVATDYRLFFPDSKTKMWLELRDPQLKSRGAPSDRTFVLPPLDDPELQTIRIGGDRAN